MPFRSSVTFHRLHPEDVTGLVDRGLVSGEKVIDSVRPPMVYLLQSDSIYSLRGWDDDDARMFALLLPFPILGSTRYVVCIPDRWRFKPGKERHRFTRGFHFRCCAAPATHHARQERVGWRRQPGGGRFSQ